MADKTNKEITESDKALDVEKASRGRPTKYKPEYCQMLIDHMSTGLSYDTFSAIIEVNIDTLYEWEKVHKEFSEAKKVAVGKCLIFWEKLGVDHILNISESESMGPGMTSSKSRSLNAAIWVFNMKNRFKWRDKQADEASDININLTLADQMAKARLRVGKK